MQGHLGYGKFCLGLVQPPTLQSKGLCKQDQKELPASCKVRRVPNAHLSPRQHTEDLALSASDADRELEQLELMVRLLEKDVSPGVLVSENLNVLQKSLWKCMCDYASDPRWQKKVDWMFMPVFNAVMKQTIADYQNITCLDGRDDKNPNHSNLNFEHVALAFQQYSENKGLIAENNEERQRRLKVCTKIIGAVVGEVMSDHKDKSEPVPHDLLQWWQSAADSNPDGVLAFCSQWAQTLSHVTDRNAGSCHPFESSVNAPASIDAMCDLLEEVVKLNPSLIQGSEKVCRLSLIINRSAAKRQEEKLKKVRNSGPAHAQSALYMSDSDDGV